jgi:hypothetical protein
VSFPLEKNGVYVVKSAMVLVTGLGSFPPRKNAVNDLLQEIWVKGLGIFLLKGNTSMFLEVVVVVMGLTFSLLTYFEIDFLVYVGVVMCGVNRG